MEQDISTCVKSFGMDESIKVNALSSSAISGFSIDNDEDNNTDSASSYRIPCRFFILVKKSTEGGDENYDRSKIIVMELVMRWSNPMYDYLDTLHMELWKIDESPMLPNVLLNCNYKELSVESKLKGFKYVTLLPREIVFRVKKECYMIIGNSPLGWSVCTEEGMSNRYHLPSHLHSDAS